MKTNLLFTTLLFSLAIATQLPKLRQDDTTVSAEGEDPNTAEVVEEIIEVAGCDMNIFSKNAQIAYYNATYGLMQGLYASENYPLSTGCLHCGSVARPIANL